MPGKDAAMPQLTPHPMLVELLEVAAGRDGESAARAHVDAGCVTCARKLKELATVAVGVLEEDAIERELQAPAAAGEPNRGAVYHHAAEGRRRAQEVVAALPGGLPHALALLARERRQPWYGFLLVGVAQGAARHVPSNPARCLQLARALESESERLVSSQPPPARAAAEALLLSCQALHCLGRTPEAREAVHRARAVLRGDFTAGDFEAALCDFFEANCASFERDYENGERLLKTSASVFARFGQEHWVGRALSAYATLLAQKGRNRAALPLFDEAIEKLDPERDTHVVTTALVNKASTLAHLELFDEARTSYARALALARREGLAYSIHVIRNGLAEIDFRRGHLARAFDSFRELAREAREGGFSDDYLFAQLYVAECLARLGREPEMRAAVEELRRERLPFDASPAFEELFTCLDRGDLDARLIAHVREYLDAAGEPGELTAFPYRSIRLVAS